MDRQTGRKLKRERNIMKYVRWRREIKVYVHNDNGVLITGFLCTCKCSLVCDIFRWSEVTLKSNLSNKKPHILNTSNKQRNERRVIKPLKPLSMIFLPTNALLIAACEMVNAYQRLLLASKDRAKLQPTVICLSSDLRT